ncbi:MAG: flippase-like domain-containing protein [Bacteroidales bacterium]|nr:flippase-like domain-containing protein [Bacteroidales bacterium]
MSTIVKFLIFMSIGAFLFWLAYRGHDFGRIFVAITEIRWGWVVLAVVLSVASHYSRALRWGLLLEPFGYRPRRLNLFFAVMIMYLANMAIPRSGEVARCGILTKYECIKFSRSLGTVVTERIADVIVFAVVAAVVFATQLDVVGRVLDNNPSVMAYWQSFENHIVLIVLAGIALVVLGFLLLRTAVRRNWFGLGDRLRKALHNLKDGMLTIAGLKKRWQFVFHSLFINFVYFFTIYLFFKAFPFTEHLGAMVALTVFVLGTFGVIVPSPGGIGTWHFIVIEVLALYGVVRDPDGGAYALVTHGMQDLLFAVVGMIAMVVMPFFNNNYQPLIPNETSPHIKEDN